MIELFISMLDYRLSNFLPSKSEIIFWIMILILSRWHCLDWSLLLKIASSFKWKKYSIWLQNHLFINISRHRPLKLRKHMKTFKWQHGCQSVELMTTHRVEGRLPEEIYQNVFKVSRQLMQGRGVNCRARVSLSSSTSITDGGWVIL